MEKPYYRCIILVLASDNQPIYRFFKSIYESYMHRNPNVKVFFTYGSGTTFTPREYDLVYPDLKETVTPPWSTRKVIRAMEYIDQNFDYDYLVRTNLSTFWYFDGLLERLSALPTTRCLSGKAGIFQPYHVGGTGMIISRDLIKEIIKYPNLINIPHPKYVAEDKMISDFLVYTLGIDPIFTETLKTSRLLCFENFTEFNREEVLIMLSLPVNKKCDHFRVKNEYDRMGIDTKIMKLLKDLYYPSILSYNRELYYRTKPAWKKFQIPKNLAGKN